MVIKAIPRNPEELMEALADPKTRDKLNADPEEMKNFMAEYARSALIHDPDIQKELAAQQTKVLQNLRDKEPDHRIPVDPTVVKEMNNGWQGKFAMTAEAAAYQARMKSACIGYPKAPGSPGDGLFESAADFYNEIDYYKISRGEPLSERASKVFEMTKVLGEGQGDQGGFLVPEEFRAQIMMLALEDAIVRPRATIIPMTRETMAIPTVRDTSHASTIHGGVRAFWTPENTASTASEPTFSQARLNAEKLAGHTQLSMELNEDSAIAIEALLTQMYGNAVAYFEDDAFITGTGAGQPTGILNAAALVTVAKETGQAASTIVWENVVKMFARMLPQSMGNAVWVTNNDTIPQLATMSLAVGTGGSAIWLQNGQGALPTSILGRPVIYTEKAETLGTAGDLYLVDLRQYLIGDRRSLMIANSPHFAFPSDQMTWKFTHRVAGRPWLDSALTPRNGTNTLSPFVNLATRA